MSGRESKENMRLREAILKIPGLYPLDQLILLHGVAGFSPSEIAAELHMTERSLSGIRERTVKKLRRALRKIESMRIPEHEAGVPTGDGLTGVRPRAWRDSTIGDLKRILAYLLGERQAERSLREQVPSVLDYSELVLQSEKEAEEILSLRVPPVAEYRAARDCCFEALRKGDPAEAVPITTALSAIAESTGLKELQWEARFYQVLNARQLGEYKEALELLNPLLQIRQVPDRLRMKLLFEHGTILCELGEPSKALKASRESLRLVQQYVHIPAMGKVFNLMGILYKELGRFDLAENALESCRRVALQIGDDWLLTLTVGNLGWLHIIRKNTEEAEVAIQRVRTLAQQSGNTRVQMGAGLQLTQLRLQQRRFDEALHEAQEIQRCAVIEGRRRYLDVIWFSKLQGAEIHRNLGNTALAEATRREAAAIQKPHTNVSIRDLSFKGTRLLLIAEKIRRAIEEGSFLERNRQTGELRFIPAE